MVHNLWACVLSLPVRGAWIEIACDPPRLAPLGSLPVRGAWIEIHEQNLDWAYKSVAPRAGSVD